MNAATAPWAKVVKAHRSMGAPRLENTDPSLLMWDMGRNLGQDQLPPRRITRAVHL